MCYVDFFFFFISGLFKSAKYRITKKKTKNNNNKRKKERMKERKKERKNGNKMRLKC